MATVFLPYTPDSGGRREAESFITRSASILIFAKSPLFIHKIYLQLIRRATMNLIGTMKILTRKSPSKLPKKRLHLLNPRYVSAAPLLCFILKSYEIL